MLTTTRLLRCGVPAAFHTCRRLRTYLVTATTVYVVCWCHACDTRAPPPPLYPTTYRCRALPINMPFAGRAPGDTHTPRTHCPRTAIPSTFFLRAARFWLFLRLRISPCLPFCAPCPCRAGIPARLLRCSHTPAVAAGSRSYLRTDGICAQTPTTLALPALLPRCRRYLRHGFTYLQFSRSTPAGVPWTHYSVLHGGISTPPSVLPALTYMGWLRRSCFADCTATWNNGDLPPTSACVQNVVPACGRRTAFKTPAVGDAYCNLHSTIPCCLLATTRFVYNQAPLHA